jgi:hypothetical protein
MKAYPSEVLVFWGNRPPTACQARPFEQRVSEEKLLVNQPEQAVESLTVGKLSHRIVASMRGPYYV